MNARARWITAIVLVAVGVLIGGIVGGLAAAIAVAIGLWRDYRLVAAVALLGLVVAALLTAFEAPATAAPTDYLFDFALDRPLAAEVGRIAGVFVLVAVVLAAIREREPGSRAAPEGADEGEGTRG